jgi:hypothetical protein
MTTAEVTGGDGAGGSLEQAAINRERARVERRGRVIEGDLPGRKRGRKIRERWRHASRTPADI